MKQAIKHSSVLDFQGYTLNNDVKKTLYLKMLYPRMIEEKMLNLLRQGRISKWFSGIGQEAIAVGATLALNSDEYIFPMHRNLGVFTSRSIPLWRLIAQWQGKKEGFTKGRDRSFHFGTQEYHIVGMISHLGAQLSLANGVSLHNINNNRKKVALAFTGEGGTSEGEFHEALNIAAVWSLPTIFLIENNGYGLSTPINEQYNANHLVDKAKGYGMEGVRINGNNILEVYSTIKSYAEDLRNNPRPVLIECDTFRMRGHEEASGTKYIPKALMELWEKKDPINNYEAYLLTNDIFSEREIKKHKDVFKNDIEAEVKKGFECNDIIPDLNNEYNDIYAPYTFKPQKATSAYREMRYIDAISEGLNIAMEKHEGLIIMGQDIAEYGGVFKITDGFVKKYGKKRVRNTPICESGVIGVGMGLSIAGTKSVIEMQFADFVTCGFNQIINNLAKSHYRWGQRADVVIRMPTGGGMAAGPFHSQSNEAWFFHTPGLKIVYPSNPLDAKGLLLAAIDDPNPILFFEHKGLYRSIQGKVPENDYNIEIGKASIVKKGSKATIITYGMGVHWALEYVNTLGLDIEIIDLRTLLPLDYETVLKSVRKTNKVLILHEDCHTGGIGGELSAYITEHAFESLDGPIKRVSSLDTPIPFNPELEQQFMAKSRLSESLSSLIKY